MKIGISCVMQYQAPKYVILSRQKHHYFTIESNTDLRTDGVHQALMREGSTPSVRSMAQVPCVVTRSGDRLQIVSALLNAEISDQGEFFGGKGEFKISYATGAGSVQARVWVDEEDDGDAYLRMHRSGSRGVHGPPCPSLPRGDADR